MSKKSATDYIKGKSPDNVSGALKKALDAIQSLKNSSGNPTMEEAVGAGNLASMQAEAAAAFPNSQTCEELQAQLTNLQNTLNSFIINPLAFRGVTKQELTDAIKAIITEMQQKGCALPPQANSQGNTSG